MINKKSIPVGRNGKRNGQKLDSRYNELSLLEASESKESPETKDLIINAQGDIPPPED